MRRVKFEYFKENMAILPFSEPNLGGIPKVLVDAELILRNPNDEGPPHRVKLKNLTLLIRQVHPIHPTIGHSNHQ